MNNELMKMNNKARFLFESALYLGLDPRQALHALGAGIEDPRTVAAGDQVWPLAACAKPAVSYQNCHA